MGYITKSEITSGSPANSEPLMKIKDESTNQFVAIPEGDRVWFTCFPLTWNTVNGVPDMANAKPMDGLSIQGAQTLVAKALGATIEMQISSDAEISVVEINGKQIPTLVKPERELSDAELIAD